MAVASGSLAASACTWCRSVRRRSPSNSGSVCCTAGVEPGQHQDQPPRRARRPCHRRHRSSLFTRFPNRISTPGARRRGRHPGATSWRMPATHGAGPRASGVKDRPSSTEPFGSAAEPTEGRVARSQSAAGRRSPGRESASPRAAPHEQTSRPRSARTISVSLVEFGAVVGSPVPPGSRRTPDAGPARRSRRPSWRGPPPAAHRAARRPAGGAAAGHACGRSFEEIQQSSTVGRKAASLHVRGVCGRVRAVDDLVGLQLLQPTRHPRQLRWRPMAGRGWSGVVWRATSRKPRQPRGAAPRRSPPPGGVPGGAARLGCVRAGHAAGPARHSPPTASSRVISSILSSA